MPSDNSTLVSPSIRRPVFLDLPEHNIERRYGGGHYYEEKPCKPKIIVKEVKVPYPVKVKETKIRTIKSKPQIIIKKVYVPKPIKVIKTVKVAVPKPIKVIKKVEYHVILILPDIFAKCAEHTFGNSAFVYYVYHSNLFALFSSPGPRN